MDDKTGCTGDVNASWSFETDLGYHGRVYGTVAYLTDPDGMPYAVCDIDRSTIEVGEPVQLTRSGDTTTVPVGEVINVLRWRPVKRAGRTDPVEDPTT